MAHDVFISYSTKDKITADAICHILEDNNIRCWIAPRNIPSGTNYADEIIDAIQNTGIVVLVYSSNSQASQFVNSEIKVAFDNNKPILSFKIDESMPKDDLNFYLKTTQWLEAYPKPEIVFEKLVNDALRLLDVKKSNVLIDSDAILKAKKGMFNQPSVKNEWLTFILMFTPLYPISLLFMGISSKMNKLTLDGVINIIPELIFLYYYLSGSSVYYIMQRNILLNFIILLWLVSLFYFLIIRKDYLFRKDILSIVSDDKQLFNDLVEEFCNI